jgi:hypothetical protein
VVQVFEGEGPRGERGEDFGTGESYGSEAFETPRLGHDIRFVLAAVGGGGIRVARAVARRHLPYLETVAINCDPRVQELEEFDRRICLGPESGATPSTGGSPLVGSELARSAEPVLNRLFEGATFVTIVASLGGGTGTGALPYVLEAAARSASALKVFVIKPFECEGERRGLAERTLARLHFLDAFVEKQQLGMATLQVLDNETLARNERRLPIGHIDRYWGEVVAHLVEREIIRPAEAVLDAERMRTLVQTGPVIRPIAPELEPIERDPLLPTGPHLAPAIARPSSDAVELTIESFPPETPRVP